MMMSEKILVVCSGNTCRSPMAVGLIRRLWPKGVCVESAGIETVAGLPPAQNAVLAMSELGINIRDNRSRPIETVEVREYDLVIAMDSGIAESLLLMGMSKSRMAVLEVADPYGRELEVYRSAAEELACKLETMRREQK